MGVTGYRREYKPRSNHDVVRYTPLPKRATADVLRTHRLDAGLGATKRPIASIRPDMTALSGLDKLQSVIRALPITAPTPPITAAPPKRIGWVIGGSSVVIGAQSVT